MEENNALVVDDDKNVGDLLRDILTEEGFRVSCCTSGKEALEAAEGKHFRVVITDYRMPGMYGTEVAKAMRNRYPQALIIGISFDSQEREFLASGADVFIFKPFCMSEFISLLQRFTRKEGGTAVEKTGAATEAIRDTPG